MFFSSPAVLRMWHWFTDYIGTIQLDPKKELAEIPDHSAFFILSPDNRCSPFTPHSLNHSLYLLTYSFMPSLCQ